MAMSQFFFFVLCRTSRKVEQEEDGRKKERKKIFQKNLFPFHFIDNVLGQQQQQQWKIKKKKEEEEVLIYNLCFLDWGRGSVNIGKHGERIDLIHVLIFHVFSSEHFVDVISCYYLFVSLLFNHFCFAWNVFYFLEVWDEYWVFMDFWVGVVGLIMKFEVDRLLET